jgi:hypothetical protein
MAGIGGYIYDTLSTAIFGLRMDAKTDDKVDYCSERYNSDRYQPSVSDVLAVKEALHRKSTLPFELVDAIVDMAEYWPHTSTILPESITVRGARDGENQFIVSSTRLLPNHN